MKLKIAAAFALLTVTAGCETITREHQVLNIADTPFLTTSAEPATKIKSVLNNRGWRVVEEAPGAITATFTKGTENPHVVTSRVNYDADSFSIDYVSSSNMMHDAGDNTIHRNYNRWIANLKRDLAGG